MGSACGIFAGGFLASRTERHDVVAASGLAAGTLIFVLVGMSVFPGAALPVVLAFAGLCVGATGPSRDMIVRASTPAGATGRVYGFVYSGVDLGSAALPLALGWLLDRGEPRAVFAAVAAVMVATIVTVVQVRRHAVPAAARP